MFWSPLTTARPWDRPDPVPAITAEPGDAKARDALARAAIGELLTAADVAAIFHLGPTRFHQKRHEFDLFKAKPAIGLHCYSGVLVHRYLSGEPVYEPTFGRKRHRA